MLTVRSLEKTRAFYGDGLGMECRQFGDGRWAVHFGRHKINLHEWGHDIEPRAARPMPGSADFCIVVDDWQATLDRLKAEKIEIVEGPVERTGAEGPIRSIYCRDPDNNLIELCVYLDGDDHESDQ